MEENVFIIAYYNETFSHIGRNKWSNLYNGLVCADPQEICLFRVVLFQEIFWRAIKRSLNLVLEQLEKSQAEQVHRAEHGSEPVKLSEASCLLVLPVLATLCPVSWIFFILLSGLDFHVDIFWVKPESGGDSIWLYHLLGITFKGPHVLYKHLNMFSFKKG